MRARIGLSGMCLCVLAAAPAAAEVRLLEPAAGASIRAGSVVEVRWTGVPEGSEELELLLSLGEGSRAPVRLTGQLHGESGSFTWRVPNLPAGRARLLVRFEESGREEEGEEGPAFTILGEPGSPVEPVRQNAGELWVGPGPVGAGPESVLAEGRDERLVPGPFSHPALATSRDDPGTAPELARPRPDERPLDPSSTAPAAPPGLDSPLVIPQRK